MDNEQLFKSIYINAFIKEANFQINEFEKVSSLQSGFVNFGKKILNPKFYSKISKSADRYFKEWQRVTPQLKQSAGRVKSMIDDVRDIGSQFGLFGKRAPIKPTPKRGIGQFVKKHPVLTGATVLGGGAGAAYGIGKSIKADYDTY